MNDQLNHLYDFHFEHAMRAQIINKATRLLHYLLTTFPDLINMQAKLAVIPGGVHKHLVALTRLAFSEGLILEAGIEDDVVDCAHQLLEDAVTPEEGEALLSAFSSTRT
ncbi:MAG: hypothetical protein M1830_006851 [Pleopsidium flavum]|nr:MAG: hypothetical protein M1830_006851 [Pleopsidium flavum]